MADQTHEQLEAFTRLQFLNAVGELTVEEADEAIETLLVVIGPTMSKAGRHKLTTLLQLLAAYIQESIAAREEAAR